MTTRLNPEARRDLIVAAAIPLFARKGFAGTTTREIAEVAGVSEALVFKHFANKTVLYDAIVSSFLEENPRFEELRGLNPSTISLIRLVCVTTEYFGAESGDDNLANARYRMFLRSLSEDSVFASVGMDAYTDETQELFEQFFDAARDAGDLCAGAPDTTTAFWIMAQHHAMLPTTRLLPRTMEAGVRIEEVVRFLLRGIGVRDSVISEHLAGYVAERDFNAMRRRRRTDERLAI